MKGNYCSAGSLWDKSRNLLEEFFYGGDKKKKLQYRRKKRNEIKAAGAQGELPRRRLDERGCRVDRRCLSSSHPTRRAIQQGQGQGEGAGGEEEEVQRAREGGEEEEVQGGERDQEGERRSQAAD